MDLNPYRLRRGPGAAATPDELLSFNWDDARAFVRRAEYAWFHEIAAVEADTPLGALDPQVVHQSNRLIANGRERLAALKRLVGSDAVAAREMFVAAWQQMFPQHAQRWL